MRSTISSKRALIVFLPLSNDEPNWVWRYRRRSLARYLGVSSVIGNLKLHAGFLDGEKAQSQLRPVDKTFMGLSRLSRSDSDRC